MPPLPANSAPCMFPVFTMSQVQPRIIFTAKHRVNFAMFNPVYQSLRSTNAVELFLSTGRYRKRPLLGWIKPREPQFLNELVFGDFDVDPAHLIPSSVRDSRTYDVYVSSNQSKLMQPRNSRISVQIFHGVSFRNFAVNPGYLRFDKLFFPGRYMMEQYIQQGLLEAGDPRIELMGMPKLDRLVDGSLDRNQILESLGLDPGRKTVLWCPTGARGNSLELLGRRGFRAIESTGVNLILKLHDHPHLVKGQDRNHVLGFANAALGEHSRLVDHSDVAPLLVAADLLVSDASSVAYEFCLLDRPIIFVEVKALLSNREKMENSTMDLETHGRNIGQLVNSPEELAEAVTRELADPARLSSRRRAAAAHIFHEPGTATARATERLLELARN